MIKLKIFIAVTSWKPGDSLKHINTIYSITVRIYLILAALSLRWFENASLDTQHFKTVFVGRGASTPLDFVVSFKTLKTW